MRCNPEFVLRVFNMGSRMFTPVALSKSLGQRRRQPSGPELDSGDISKSVMLVDVGVGSGPTKLTVSTTSPVIAQVEITAKKVSILSLSMSCVVRQVAKFDVCPWGMIFRSRERARDLRSFQINPWSPGYHIVLQCNTSGSKQSEAIGADWVIEKGSIRVGIPRDYRCPWDRKVPR
jgi:hypothetical protein